MRLVELPNNMYRKGEKVGRIIRSLWKDSFSQQISKTNGGNKKCLNNWPTH